LSTPQIRVTDDLSLLLDVLPPEVRSVLAERADLADLVEVVLDLGRPPEARFPHGGVFLAEEPIRRQDLDFVTERVGRFGADNRAGIERTLHRISALRNRQGDTVGLTCRVGRAVFGTVDILRDVVEEGRSLLLLGRPGVGKTTLLREAARVLADDLGKRVVVVDTSNEIAGDGDVPHPGIGRARRMQVPVPAAQADVMIEAVENHMPEVIVIDEIGTRDEAVAARTIAERGVQLIATAHGNTLENLLQNPTLSDLVGGIQVVTLGDEEARRRGTQKTVLERKAPPTFDVLVEIETQDTLAVHHDVAEVVDHLLRGAPPRPQRRRRKKDGEVEIRQPAAASAAPGAAPRPGARRERPAASRRGAARRGGGLRDAAFHDAAFHDAALPDDVADDRDDEAAPRPTATSGEAEEASGGGDGPEAHRRRWPGAAGSAGSPPAGGVAPGRASRILRVFPYAVSRNRLERAVRKFGVPAYVVEDLRKADVILTTKSQERRQPRRLRDAQAGGVPLYVVKNNTVTQMESFLRDAFQLAHGRDDETAALEEAEAGVEEVMENRQPVELAPRGPYLRRLQHLLAEQHHLSSESHGEEPHRRVVIYPP
jgi:stage III sporulation protein SpoIIIAA